jgi:hypothetical protein
MSKYQNTVAFSRQLIRACRVFSKQFMRATPSRLNQIHAIMPTLFAVLSDFANPGMSDL